MKPTQHLLTAFFALWSLCSTAQVIPPSFADCPADTVNCTEHALYHYTQQALKSIQKTRKTPLKGIVKVSFVIMQTGKITSVQVEESFDDMAARIALHVILSMNTTDAKWKAGQKDGAITSFQVLHYPLFFDEAMVQRQPPTIAFQHFKNKITPITIGGKKPPKDTIKTIVIEKAEDMTIYEEVDIPPIFPGCQDGGPFRDSLRANDCTNTVLNSFIYKKLEYPADAFYEGIEGVVVVSYVVEKDGRFSTIKCLRDIGGGCGNAAVALLEQMNTLNIKWQPAYKNQQPVRSYHEVKIRFNITTEKARRSQQGQ